MTRISLLPQDDDANGWAVGLAHRDPNPPLRGHAGADFAVIGAGYAGLAAARRLAEARPDAEIALIEAQTLGAGASARNSGFALELHHLASAPTDLARSHAHRRLSQAAIAELRRIVQAHHIPCDWSEIGRYHAAVSPRGTDEVIAPAARMLEEMGEDHDWLDRDELRARLGTGHFHAAVYSPAAVLLNPAELVRGLGETLPDNVTFYENSPVIEADFATRARLRTPEGQLRAGKVILGVNGLAMAFGFWRDRLINVAAHASLTRRLDDDEHAALGNIAPWGVIPANAFAGITMRYTNDRRILIRQDIHFCPGLRQSDRRRAQIAAQHQRLFAARFPMLPKVTMAHTWTGFMCVSRNDAPAFGQVAGNVWTASCQNGVGITRATIGGILAADLALDRDNPLLADMESLGRPPRNPPRPFLDLGVRARMAFDGHRSRHEA